SRVCALSDSTAKISVPFWVCAAAGCQASATQHNASARSAGGIEIPIGGLPGHLSIIGIQCQHDGLFSGATQSGLLARGQSCALATAAPCDRASSLAQAISACTRP